MDHEWAPRPTAGRVFRSSRQVRLSDAGPAHLLRPDGAARYLQDVAVDDSDDAGFPTGPGTDNVWLVRRTSMRVRRWPRLGEAVSLATWCGGLGRAWAIRRTDICVGDEIAVETSALWVHLDGKGRPARLDEAFLATYSDAAGGRTATVRLDPPEPVPASASRRSWFVRATDLDVIGHVNNAAVWAALVEAVGGEVAAATIAHHGPVEAGDQVTMCVDERDGSCGVWLVVGDDIRVSGVATPR
jgi:acyl-ACP thioesterase